MPRPTPTPTDAKPVTGQSISAVSGACSLRDHAAVSVPQRAGFDADDPACRRPTQRLAGYDGAVQDSQSGGRTTRRDVLRYAASAPVLLSLSMIPSINVPRAHATSSIAGKIVFLDPGHNGANYS